MNEETAKESLYRFLPKGAKLPHLQCMKKDYEGWFVIPKLSPDKYVVCSGKNECFIFINRGYYCKKHRV